MPRPEIFSIDSPSVVVETTTASDDGSWLASGTVTFELATGECLPFAFKNARNRGEAIEGALVGLERHLQRFQRAVEKLRGTAP